MKERKSQIPRHGILKFALILSVFGFIVVMGCSTSTTSEQNSAPAVVETTQTLIQPTPIAVIPAETKPLTKVT
jgi:lysophospholipid acyltransferase (LPLAT)-like uncharacterized protein